jgi:hypothetical protein
MEDMDMKKKSLLTFALAACAALCLSSCAGRVEPAFPEGGAVRFSLLDEGYNGPETRTLLTAPDIETKRSSVTLAAYRAGTLYASGYFTSGLSAMPLALIAGETYDVYAFVNMGDLTGRLPSSASGLSGVTYDIPSWQSVNSSGIPMTGVLESFTVSASSPQGTVPVKRRFAKVTATLTCTWPGARITGAVVGNMNGRIPLAGAAAMSGSGDALSWEDADTGNGSSATMLFYVPENLQGTISGISASYFKNHEKTSAVNAVRGRLTYLEVSVSGSTGPSAMYGGAVTYRSYLGANETTNFDIAGNTAYVWNITYGEDGLAEDTWKVDTDDLEDRRTFSWNQNPIYVEPGQAVTFADWYTTNITTGIDVALFGDVSDALASSDATGFTVKPDAEPAKQVTATGSPVHNPIQSLIKSTVFIVRRWVAEWKGYDPDIYASEGKKVYVVDYHGGADNNSDKTVAPTVDYWQNPGGTPQRGLGQAAPGSGSSSRWTYSVPTGMNAQYSGSQDRVTYTVPKTVLLGDYPISATVRSDGYEDIAYIRMVDTRFLYWRSGTSLFSEREYNMGNSTTFPTGANSAFSFVFGDETGSGSPVSGNVFSPTNFNYPYLYGQRISGSYLSALQDNLVIEAPSSLSFTSGPSFTPSGNGNSLVGRLTGTLSSLPSYAGPHVITVRLADDPSVAITLSLTFNTSGPEVTYEESLILEPTSASINVGSTHAFTSLTLRVKTYEDGVLVSTEDTPLAFDASGLAWSSNHTNIATVSAGRVTGVATGSAVITATYSGSGLHNGPVSATCNVTVNEEGVEIESGWSDGGHTTLDP